MYISDNELTLSIQLIPKALLDKERKRFQNEFFRKF